MTDRRMTRGAILVLIGTGLLALGMRVASLLLGATSVLRSHLRLDEALYADWASGEVGRFDQGVSYVVSPVMPWLIEAFGGAAGVRWTGIVLSVLTVVFAADLARRWAGTFAAAVTGVLLAIAWPLIHYSTTLVEAPLLGLLVMLALWWMTHPRGGGATVLVPALLIGVAGVARPVMLLLLIPLIREGWRSRTISSRGVIVATLVGLLPVAGIASRNLVVAGEWLPVPASTGIVVRAAMDPAFDGHSGAAPGWGDTWAQRWQAARIELPGGRTATATQVGRAHLIEGLRSVTRDPMGAIALQGKKLRYLVGDRSREDGFDLEYWRRVDPVTSVPILPSMAVFLGLSVAGWVNARRREDLQVLRSWTLALAAVCLLAFVTERFRLPLYGLLGIWAGIGFAGLWSNARQNRRTLLVALPLALLVMGVSLTDRWLPQRPGAAVDNRLQEARFLVDANRFDEALLLYADVVGDVRGAGGDQELSARCGMVATLLEMNRFEEAEQQLLEVESEWPDAHEVLVLRGRWFLRHDRHAAAFPLYRRVLDENPDDVEALIGIGWCQIESNARKTAEDNLRRAQVVGGPRAEIWAALGVIEAYGKRNHQLARGYFERAVDLDWHTPIAHQFLGQYYREVDDDFLAALYHFRQCLLQDPLNLVVRRFLVRAKIDIDQLLADEALARPERR